MLEDCYIPWHEREQSELTKSAKCNHDIVRNGKDRGEENCWTGKNGDFVEYTFDTAKAVDKIRLIFDSNLNRNYRNMPCSFPLVQKDCVLPDTLIKEYRIDITDEAGNTESFEINDNHQRLVWHSIGKKVKSIRLTPIATNGCDEFRLFGFELY